MEHWMVGAGIALLPGISISYLNYRLSVYMLAKNSAFLQISVLARQLLNIGYLVAVYFLAPYTPWDSIVMLSAAVVGITVSLFFFTRCLVRRIDEENIHPKNVSDSDKQQPETDDM